MFTHQVPKEGGDTGLECENRECVRTSTHPD